MCVFQSVRIQVTESGNKGREVEGGEQNLIFLILVAFLFIRHQTLTASPCILVCVNQGFLTRMVRLHYISCMRYTTLVGNPRNAICMFADVMGSFKWLGWFGLFFGRKGQCGLFQVVQVLLNQVNYASVRMLLCVLLYICLVLRLQMLFNLSGDGDFKIVQMLVAFSDSAAAADSIRLHRF